MSFRIIASEFQVLFISQPYFYNDVDAA